MVKMNNLTQPGRMSINIQDVSRRRQVSQRSAGSNEQPEVEKMRRRLQFYFMNPLEKWHAKRQFPYKLAIQLIKIVVVTFQLCLFATYRYANVNYIMDNKVAFSNLFLKDWNSDREITTYPPTDGPFAIYTKDDFYQYIDFTVNAYANIEDLAIGSYFYGNPDGTIAPVQFCQTNYATGVIFGFNESYIFDSTTEKKCVDIPSAILDAAYNFSSEKFFQDQNIPISFDSLLDAHVMFTLKTVRFRDLGPLKSPDCFQFDIDILFNNRDHDGEMLIDLDAQSTRLDCSGDLESSLDNQLERFWRSGMNYLVIAVGTLSLVLCCRAIYRAQLLKREAITFFRKYYNRDLNTDERLDFINFWFLLIILNDILIIVGSGLKEGIENKELTGDAWNICSLLLGVGNLFVWFGVLRYFGFFRTYNVLILTLKRATPHVLRFLICAILLYAGFTFCGWLILGPYHIKFRTLSTTSECLFAIINGDDIFGTFASLSSKSSIIWWFCRIYLYAFCSLFIYVVLSLFIALIMDAYETIKLFYTDGFPRSMLEEFVIGADIGNLQQSSSPSAFSSPSGSRAHIPMAFSRQPSIASEMTRRLSMTSLTAGGLLDTIVETICRCNTPSPDGIQETDSAREMRVSHDGDGENDALLESR
ncbi:Mucolipin-3 [Orchesella cincta]|uniref:Mucolipin-3 n=1 Tax=Orchesella cincta TaxID=48709 RepID=A0A1D2MDF0_ORCCI|nr:Mucolipin-3 [Orchesella cincta]